MGKVISVASGKGGVGKSTICCHLGRALAEQGKTVVILEMDSGLRGMDIMLGVSDSIYDFSDFIQNRCTLRDATVHVHGCPGLFLVSAPAHFVDILTEEQLRAICSALKGAYDYVLVDTTAGYGLIEFLPKISDLICIVATPDPVCVRDAAVFTDALRSSGAAVSIRLIINRVTKNAIKKHIISDLDAVIDETGLKLLGVISERQEIYDSTAKGKPLENTGKPYKIFDAIAGRIQGNQVPLVLKSL